MPYRLIAVTVCLTGLLLANGAPVRAPRASMRTMAVTFDDLPFVNAGGGAYLPAARRTTTEIVKVLRRHQAPAVGFVNERQLDTSDREARTALLEQWIAAGMTLGNHTYSHPDFNSVSIEQFKEEIVKGEPAVRALMAAKPGARMFFRHPMTHTGNTTEKKAAIDAFLLARGYTIAPHTIENSDFIFNVLYVRALDAKDAALAARVRDAYLEFTFAATGFAEHVAVQIFGGEVPHTLLLHSNALNADTLDGLLTRYRKRGYRFTQLETAMTHPAYRTEDTLVTAYGPTWLWRWARSLGLQIGASGDPEPPAWVIEAFKQR